MSPYGIIVRNAVITTLCLVLNACGGGDEGSGNGGGGGPTPAAIAGLNSTSLSFAARQVGTTSAAQTVTLTNTGTAALSISAIAITGTNTASFAQTNNCGSSLAVSGSCAISITFTPTAAGSLSASLALTSNGGNPAVALSGNGLAAIAASLSASNATPLVNETITLTWTSQNASTCQMSSGGANIATAGSTTVSYSTTASQVVSITCAGVAGTVPATSSVTINPKLVTTYSVPTDPSLVSYPASYTSATTRSSDINTDPCKLDLSVVTYPQSWLGSRPLPTVSGAPLSTGIGRVVMLKDIMLPNNPAFVLDGVPGAPPFGCTGSLQSEFTKLVSRLKALGVDTLGVTQWHWAVVNSDGSFGILPAESSFGPLPDVELAGLVQKAHAQGIKVLSWNQVGGFVDSTQNIMPTPASNSGNYDRWLTALHALMVQRAAYFQSIGIDIWEMGCNLCVYQDQGDGSPAAQAQFASRYQTMINDVAAIYHGKKLGTWVPWFPSFPSYVNALDIIETGPFIGNFNAQQEAAATVASIKANFIANNNASNFAYILNIFPKPLLIFTYLQSRSNALSVPGYMEETNCTDGVGDLRPVSPTTCVQRDTPPDFGLQAIYLEASMETLAGLTLPPGSMVAITDYWATDSLMPATAFPNIGASIRNKPAEGLLRQWFAR